MTARTRLSYTSSGIHACKNELVLKLHIILPNTLTHVNEYKSEERGKCASD